MDYNYYVAYAWNKGANSGFGDSRVMLNKPFNTQAGMEAMIFYLQEKYGYDSLVILNIITLKD